MPNCCTTLHCIAQKTVTLLKFEWLEWVLKPPKKLYPFNPELLGQNREKPKKTQKGFSLVLILVFRPPWSLTTTMAAKFYLLEAGCKSTSKLLQNVGLTFAIQLLTLETNFWSDLAVL